MRNKTPETFLRSPAPRSAALCRTRRGASLPFCGRRLRGDRLTMQFNRGSSFRIGGRDGARPSQCFSPVVGCIFRPPLSKIGVSFSENADRISKSATNRKRNSKFTPCRNPSPSQKHPNRIICFYRRKQRSKISWDNPLHMRRHF